MAIEAFEGPIPGQSLTTPPKSNRWERPPDTVDPEEALHLYLTRMNQPKKMQAVLDALEFGADIRSLVTGMTRGGVAEGVHTVDVSLIIAPVIHEYIRGIAEEAGIPYKDGFVDEDAEKKERREVAMSKARDKLEKAGYLKETSEEKKPVQVADKNVPGDSEEMPERASGGIMKRRDRGEEIV